VSFQVLKPDIDETVGGSEPPEAYVTRLAIAKAGAGWKIRAVREAAVWGADTAVVLDGRIFGKPVDAHDGVRMLRALAGRTHEVYTAIALASTSGIRSRVSRSEVTLREISAAEADEYWKTGEPHDKAGGYAIQGRAAIFIADLRGSFSGVMGLPLYETAELLGALNLPRWRFA